MESQPQLQQAFTGLDAGLSSTLLCLFSAVSEVAVRACVCELGVLSYSVNLSACVSEGVFEK